MKSRRVKRRCMTVAEAEAVRRGRARLGARIRASLMGVLMTSTDEGLGKRVEDAVRAEIARWLRA